MHDTFLGQVTRAVAGRVGLPGTRSDCRSRARTQQYVRMDTVGPDELTARYVQPFYLKMMRTNAVDCGLTLAFDIAAVGRTARPEDVITLLRGSWRGRVMGAWLRGSPRRP